MDRLESEDVEKKSATGRIGRRENLGGRELNKRKRRKKLANHFLIAGFLTVRFYCSVFLRNL